MTNRYVEGHWIEDFQHDGLRWMPSGYYDDSTYTLNYPPESIIVGYHQLSLAIPLMESRGIIKPRLDERLRVEDLKITHRLIDILDKVSEK